MGGVSKNSCSSSGSQVSKRRFIYCDCGVRSPLLTSWTDENYGRKFFGCGLYEVYGKKCCDFFQWFDDDDSIGKDHVIARLVKRIEEMKNKNEEFIHKNEELKHKLEEMKKKQSVMLFFLAVSLLLLILLVTAYVTK